MARNRGPIDGWPKIRPVRLRGILSLAALLVVACSGGSPTSGPAATASRIDRSHVAGCLAVCRRPCRPLPARRRSMSAVIGPWPLSFRQATKLAVRHRSSSSSMATGRPAANTTSTSISASSPLSAATCMSTPTGRATTTTGTGSGMRQTLVVTSTAKASTTRPTSPASSRRSRHRSPSIRSGSMSSVIRTAGSCPMRCPAPTQTRSPRWSASPARPS